MIIDIHTHCYPQRIAQHVLRASGRNNSFPPVCDATLAGTRALMQACGVDKFALLPVGTMPSCHSSNQFSCDHADEMIIPFGTVHPAAEDLEGEVERLALMGLKGVKLHPQYQQTLISDTRYIRIIRRAATLGLVVIFHAGIDPELSPPWLSLPSDIARLLDVVEDTDGLVLIAAHLGGFGMFDDVEKYLVGRNLYFDTACIAKSISAAQYRRIIERHGYTRILFGSDCPWQRPDVNIQAIRRLGLPQEQLEMILGGNAQRILHIQ